MHHPAQDMFGAGTDTSSLVLELAMAELMRNPKQMAKLQAQVRRHTPEGQETVEEENLSDMPYLRAVVKETLRLHPPAPLLVPHLSPGGLRRRWLPRPLRHPGHHQRVGSWQRPGLVGEARGVPAGEVHGRRQRCWR